jgi:hypothetical protein
MPNKFVDGYGVIKKGGQVFFLLTRLILQFILLQAAAAVQIAEILSRLGPVGANLILKTVVAGAGGSYTGNAEGIGLEAQQRKTSNHSKKGPLVDVQQDKEMEISSLEASERSGAVGVEGNVGGSTTKSKKRSKKTKENDVQFSIHVNEKLIRFCKFYKDTRDCNPLGSMAAFVRKNYYNDMYERCEDNEAFAIWWSRKQASLKERIKVKRTNIMSAMHKTFKCKFCWRRDWERCW